MLDVYFTCTSTSRGKLATLMCSVAHVAGGCRVGQWGLNYQMCEFSKANVWLNPLPRLTHGQGQPPVGLPLSCFPLTWGLLRLEQWEWQGAPTNWTTRHGRYRRSNIIKKTQARVMLSSHVSSLWSFLFLTFYFVLGIANEQCCDSFRWRAKGFSLTWTGIHSPPNSTPI